MTRVAAIDCGTNSIRLLIADIEHTNGATKLTDIVREMRVVRLGQGVDATGELAPEALERTFAATADYAALIREYQAQKIRFVATSASRDARNRQVFVDGIQNLIGVEPEVITGDEEAALSFAGASSVLPISGADKVLVVDLGGGSTEFEILGRESVFAGVSDFVYAPRDARVQIASGAGGRFALAGAKCERRLPARRGPAPEVLPESHMSMREPKRPTLCRARPAARPTPCAGR